MAWMLIYGATIGLSSLSAVDPLSTMRSVVIYLRDVAIAFVLVNLVTTTQGLRSATWADTRAN